VRWCEITWAANSAPIITVAIPIAGTTTLGSPSFATSVVPEAIRTIPSAIRRKAWGALTERLVPMMTPGTDPIRMLPASPKSMFPPTQCAAPAAHSRTAAWKTSVPTTRCGVSWKIAIRAMAISVPLPAEVNPITKPQVAPVTIAAMMWRR